jgi:glycosyltransferase involved in cell wall biosynthesis
MIIGIDGNEGNVSKRVGISEYVYELLTQFAKGEGQEVESSFEIYLKQKTGKDFPSESKNWHYKVFGPSKLWTQIALPAHLFLERQKPDVFFSPAHYAPRFSPVPTVVSIMDLAFFHFPELFTKKDLNQLKSWTGYSIKKAKKIITISQASKDDIIKLYGIEPERIAVIYPGIKQQASLTPHIYPMNELKTRYKIGDNFLLFVGTLQPRKNVVRIIEAFAETRKQKTESGDHDLELVIIGRKGWQYEEILAAPEKYGVKNQVKFLDFVPDEDLMLFYQHAQAFVWPSLYEGFGLPVLEAMKFGCPVITSNVSSLPEAGGDAALYVDPENVEEIKHAIEKVVSDEKLRNEMVAKGKKQVEKFSWEKAAKETLEVLQEVGKHE